MVRVLACVLAVFALSPALRAQTNATDWPNRPLRIIVAFAPGSFTDVAARAMGAFAQRFRACASLHGSWIVTDDSDSPHRSAQKGAGELYCALAEKDRHAQPAKLKVLREASWKLKFHHELHAGADHGYALPDRDVHDKQAANRDWEVIFGMFRRQMLL